MVVVMNDKHITELDELEAQLQHALDKARSTSLPAHAVRNCPSDLQASDEAWRKVKSLQYRIKCLKDDLND